MDMGDLLPRMLARVGQKAIARRLKTQILGDLADGADKAGDLVLTGLGAEVGKRAVGALRNDQDMYRRLRGDVVERECERVLIDFLARDFATQDPREDVLAVIGWQAADRHGSISWTNVRHCSTASACSVP